MEMQRQAERSQSVSPRSKLDTLTNIVIIVTLAFFVGITAKREFFPRGLQADGRGAGFVGKSFPGVAGLVFDSHEKTMILIASSNCKYCVASAEFYGRLFAAISKSPGVQAAVLYPSNELKFHWADASPIPESIRKIPVELLKLDVQGTPTLLVVGRDGIVKKAWAGQLGLFEERAVLTEIASVHGE